MRFIASVILGFSLLTVGASCNQAEYTNANIPTQTKENIEYGTNADPIFLEESRQDCEQRGGTFNECGSACAEGEICIQVCTAVCEF